MIYWQIRSRQIKFFLYYPCTDHFHTQHISIYFLPYYQIQENIQMGKKIIQNQSQKNLQARKVTIQFIKTMLKRKVQGTRKIAKLITRQKLTTIVTQDMMTCPLCLQTMVTPVVTECGHNYCLMCIQDYFFNACQYRNDPKCSICRNQLEFYDYHESSPLKVVIHEYLLKLDKTTRDEYSIRQKKSDRQEQRRLFRQFQVGVLIDYFDCNAAQWKDGAIISIFINDQGVLKVTIQGTDQEGKGIKYFRFAGNSRKIAKHHYFTQESDQEQSESS